MRPTTHGLPRALYTSADRGSVREPREDFRRSRRRSSTSQTTATFFRYFTHLTGGRLDPRALQSLWTLKPEKPDLVAALTTAVKNNDLTAAMERLQPQHPEYRELQKALVRYRAIAAKGGWPSIPPNTRLKPHQQSAVVPDAAAAAGDRRRSRSVARKRSESRFRRRPSPTR